MTSLFASIVPAVRLSRGQLFRGFSVLFATCAISSAVFAQAADPNATPNAGGRQRGQRGQNGANAADAGNGGRGGRGNFDPAQVQQQMMDRMREQFDVTDDAEWKLISDRVTAVTELRRTAGPGGGGGFGGFRGGAGGPGGPGGGGGGQGGGGRGGRGGAASPEQDALRQAIVDKLPDAEVKARLARVREVKKANEEKLTKAQEDLRAVLNVRQEAVAVMAGLLP